MKIPETSANIGAYYGNEENGQWQPNGVIIDGGVGGGVVGSGDAGMHRPPVYPLHIPRGHVPGMVYPLHIPRGQMPAGYVMAGAYYGAGYPAAPPQPDDFADYMWMENEEEFDKQVLQQLEEEALMEQCIEAMLEDEQRERRQNRGNRHDYPTTSNGNPAVSLQEAVSRSTLNPLAAEFVPTGRRPPAAHTEEKKESAPTQGEVPSPAEEPSGKETDAAEDKDSRPDVTEEEKTEETASPPKDPPEVSAADIHPISRQNKKDKETKKQEAKKAVKVETKKKPAGATKSDTKVQVKKKEVKGARSDARLESHDSLDAARGPEPAHELDKPQSPTTEEAPNTTGLKPINYAAAARASKPKPKPTSPPVEKPTAMRPDPPKDKLKEKVEKKLPLKEKTTSKEKVNVQRKNSTK